jgi:outer membrane protein TolC
LKSTNRVLRLFLIAVLFSSADSKAQSEKSALSLADCLRYASVNNSDIKKAALEEEKSGKKINEVIGSGLPQVTLTGSLVNNLELPTQVIAGDYFGAPGTWIPAKFGTKYNYTFTGEVTQLIFNGSFWVGLNAAKYSKLYYMQTRENVSEDVGYSVASTYYQTLVVQKQVDFKIARRYKANVPKRKSQRSGCRPSLCEL